jgi:hypothetical protein
MEYVGLETYEMVEDLVANDGDHLEGLRGGDAVDEEVTVQADELYCTLSAWVFCSLPHGTHSHAWS